MTTVTVSHHPYMQKILKISKEWAPFIRLHANRTECKNRDKVMTNPMKYIVNSKAESC